jgi:NodT family efflux transporter outer membrane factor (OMF) lipoprotein
MLAADEPLPGTATPRVPLGLPSDLLRRRPDIRGAERELAAATARIGVATAGLFPRFQLTALAGLHSTDGEDLFDEGSGVWSLGPSVSWPIFHAGEIRQSIRVQDARTEQALLRYEQVVLTALEEVENALLGFGQEQDRHRSLLASERASRRAVELADDRYRGGLVDFLDVLSAQRMLLDVQSEVVQSKRRLSQELVRLYAALGGGWDADSIALDAADGRTSSS